MKPVYLHFKSDSLFMCQNGAGYEVFWNEVTKVVFNGRFLDFFGESSIRYTFDLNSFGEPLRLEIMQFVQNEIKGRGIEMDTFD